MISVRRGKGSLGKAGLLKVVQPSGNGAIPFITLTASGYGHDYVLQGASVPFPTFTATGNGGGSAAIPFCQFTASGAGTAIETGKGAIPFAVFTAAGTGHADIRAAAATGFVRLTASGYGGASAQIPFPSFTAAGTGTDIARGSGKIQFIELRASGTGHEDIHGHGAISFITLSSFRGGNANIPFPIFTASGKGHVAIANAVAYVMNIHTGESTRYSNYAFMHIVTIGGKFYGVKADGLYLLEGATDNGAAINGTITTKDTDFGSFNSKRVEYAYLNNDSTATTVQPIVDGVIKNAHTCSFAGRKAKLSLGNQGRYWQFKVANITKLEGLELLPQAQQRRVK